MITENRLEEAIKFIAESDESSAEASANVKYLDRLLKRKKALLNFFGSARSVGQAKIEELTSVEGISLNIATSIFDWFHD